MIQRPIAITAINIKTAITAGIQSGESTHNHDQAITLHNFKAMKSIDRSGMNIERMVTLFSSDGTMTTPSPF